MTRAPGAMHKLTLLRQAQSVLALREIGQYIHLSNPNGLRTGTKVVNAIF